LYQTPAILITVKMPLQNSHSPHSNRGIRPGMMIPQAKSSPHRGQHSRQKGRGQIIQITRMVEIRTRHSNLHNPRRMVTRTIQQIPRHSPHRSLHSRRKSPLMVATVMMMIIPLQ
jgi:hypothetical protein